MAEDTFTAEGVTFHVPGFDEMVALDRAVLMAFTALPLRKFRESGVITIPDITEVLEYVIAMGTTGVKSRKSRSYIYSAIRFLTGKGLIRQDKGTSRHPCYSSILLELRPKSEFVAE